jgi:hypothetical protein
VPGRDLQVPEAHEPGHPGVPVGQPVASLLDVHDPPAGRGSIAGAQGQHGESPAGHPFPAWVAELAGQRERLPGVVAGLVVAPRVLQAVGPQSLRPGYERVPAFPLADPDAPLRSLNGLPGVPGEQ